MNKKIILSTAIALLLASTSLVAQQKCGTQDKGAYTAQSKMQRAPHTNKTNYISMFMHLDLSDKQRADIRNIMRESMKNRPNPNTTFTDSSFNQKEYVAMLQAQKNTRIEKKAQMIADIYALLTAEQKKDFKTMLDMKEIMKKNKKPKSFR